MDLFPKCLMMLLLTACIAVSISSEEVNGATEEKTLGERDPEIKKDVDLRAQDRSEPGQIHGRGEGKQQENKIYELMIDEDEYIRFHNDEMLGEFKIRLVGASLDKVVLFYGSIARYTTLVENNIRDIGYRITRIEVERRFGNGTWFPKKFTIKTKKDNMDYVQICEWASLCKSCFNFQQDNCPYKIPVGTTTIPCYPVNGAAEERTLGERDLEIKKDVDLRAQDRSKPGQIHGRGKGNPSQDSNMKDCTLEIHEDEYISISNNNKMSDKFKIRLVGVSADKVLLFHGRLSRSFKSLRTTCNLEYNAARIEVERLTGNKPWFPKKFTIKTKKNNTDYVQTCEWASLCTSCFGFQQDNCPYKIPVAIITIPCYPGSNQLLQQKPI